MLGFAEQMSCRFFATVLLLALPDVAQARDALGVFEGWGAFRDPAIARCYAISEPVSSKRKRGNGWRAFASVGSWTRKGVRGQFHARLTRARAEGTKVMLTIGDRRFLLVAGSADAWASDRQSDAAIIAAMRSATTMTIEATASNGAQFADRYDLRGAATAMDAAALGCGRN